MVVKILSSARSFKGVHYNTDKVEDNHAELLKVANFGPLQALDRVRPEDYMNYLKMVSAQNKNIRKPQFHVMISTKGREHSKEELSGIAEKWLAKMGYAEQPYLLVFHKDTRNNHVHIVSTRVDKNGDKISSAFEKNRAIQSLNQVMGLDEKWQAQADFEKAMTYKFSSKTQFLMLLETKGYSIGGDKEHIQLIKFGKVAAEFDPALLNMRLAELKASPGKEDIDKRKKQLTALFYKYLKIHSSELYPVIQPLAGGREKALSAFTSDFAQFLKINMGIELIFHSKYAYSIIDNSDKNVLKGSQIMDLKTLLNHQLARSVGPESKDSQSETAVLNADSTLIGHFKGNEHSAVSTPSDSSGKLGTVALSYSDPIAPVYSTRIAQAGNEDADYSYSHGDEVNIDLTDDIDDEAILGRNRRRQRKARTNTR
ncbi:relaxase/mobilization nuclease domain-containing protein [Pedobacter sp. MC2016-24]|uniref:relaxase/mobilization nuclease domain-containing protein n=1 Tax=Pedobacter sp. MC2016-24 TaxID=2780090 RepID=UPI00187F7D3E|nr:relaxase/mobilization nuclease domain-containing protein [Pedobacter sp. MC2016-24]MBE9599888.1 relaxase/mobilization nuclease domain-containing protein [Pedobacter sp. MC2016-24]